MRVRTRLRCKEQKNTFYQILCYHIFSTLYIPHNKHVQHIWWLVVLVRGTWSYLMSDDVDQFPMDGCIDQRLYLTAPHLQTDALGFLKNLFNVQLHWKFVNVLEEKKKKRVVCFSAVKVCDRAGVAETSGSSGRLGTSGLSQMIEMFQTFHTSGTSAASVNAAPVGPEGSNVQACDICAAPFWTTLLAAFGSSFIWQWKIMKLILIWVIWTDQWVCTLRISLKPYFSSMIFCFSESRMAQQTSRWKFWQGRPVHITCGRQSHEVGHQVTTHPNIV